LVRPATSREWRRGTRDCLGAIPAHRLANRWPETSTAACRLPRRSLLMAGSVRIHLPDTAARDREGRASRKHARGNKDRWGILIGKTTTSEFGCKPVGDSPLTGITRNPWNLDKTPGGSSAGAAASVAAGITPFALGTDGGGSIRIPAAFTGLAGLKGQFGRVPVWPTSATPTLAHVGPLARSVKDAAFAIADTASVARGWEAGVPIV
jgi:Amidase